MLLFFDPNIEYFGGAADCGQNITDRKPVRRDDRGMAADAGKCGGGWYEGWYGGWYGGW